ncbi:formate/nitrite transporter family protein [Streptomyces sp. NPDC005423]|uniref:formate/nitrite transporter family protein n=1 Tax=Streptomyces sp. NPDC005423 TaxID=3155343 RepID=UPI0033B0CB68
MRGPGERRIADAAERIVSEGEPRLHRTWLALIATSLLGGIDVGVGIMALLFVRHATGSELLAGIAFSVGFIALLLGHSELFTEGFLVPVATVVAHAATWLDLARMWATVLVMNLVGGWIFTWLVMTAYPELHGTAAALGAHYVNGGYTLRTFCLAVLAGGVITLMTRMHHGSDSMTGKLAASVATAFVLAGFSLWHSVLDSLLAFAGLHTGHAAYGYADWARWLAWCVLGNIVGGLLLTTAPRLVRSSPVLDPHADPHADPDADPDADAGSHGGA